MTIPPHLRCATVRIAGMTCASCELLLERKIKGVAGVQSVDISHRTGIARITADANNLPDYERIASAVRKAGYSMAEDGAPTVASVDPDKRKWMEIGGSLLIIFTIYKLLQAFDLVSLAPSTSGALSLGGIFVIGLIAGTSSCLAVTGGVPVRWVVDGQGAIGCTSQLVIPDLNVVKSLLPGENIIEFTAPKPGRLAFSCSMGMVRGSFNVL